MTTNTILQLARFNSTNSPSAAEWTTTLREPVILNEGDTLSVRQAFVDSRLHSSTNIVIPVDLPISLTYYFYVMFPCDKLSYQDADYVAAQSATETNLGPVDPNDGNDVIFASYTWKYAAVDYVAWAGVNAPDVVGGPVVSRLQKPLNTFEVGRSYPEAPTTYETGIGWDANINQCVADEIPMLLITNDLGAGAGYPLENTPITKTWRYTIKAGSYDPAELADLLTKNMAEIQTDKTTPSYSPYQLFGGTTPTNLNNFLQKGTAVEVVTGYIAQQGDEGMPQAVINHRYEDNLVQEGKMLFSSNSDAFASQPQHTGVFTNFLVDTPMNTNYLNPTFHDYYGNYDTSYNENVAKQFLNPIMFMPSHYAGSVANAVGIGYKDQFDPQPTLINWTKTYNSSVVGASEISLEFNTETSLFQFTYLHSPIQELPLTAGTSSAEASEPVEVVKICKTVNINRYDKSNLNTPPNPTQVTNYADGEVKICEQTRHSGIFFQSMEPIEFWQQIMGFDVPNITVPLEKVWGLNRSLTFAEFNKVTTSGFVGIENNFNLTATGTPTGTGQTLVVPNKNAPAYIAPVPLVNGQSNPNAGVYSYTQLLNSDEWILENYVLHNDFIPFNGDYFPWQTTRFYYDYTSLAGPNSDFYEEYSSALNATNPLSAIQIPLSQNNGTGHYFIEVVGYNNNVNDFINDNSIYAIKSIVASYYVSPNSFVTQPFQDTAIYEHIGDTQYINKFRVRLLDPLTMLPTAPLGPNSSVYLQLGKQLSKLALTQPM